MVSSFTQKYKLSMSDKFLAMMLKSRKTKKRRASQEGESKSHKIEFIVA